MTKVADLVLSLVNGNPSLTNEQVADEVRRRLPAARATAASVSSIKSMAKRTANSGKNTNVPLFPPSTSIPMISEEDLPDETLEERSARIRRRYRTLERMALRVADGSLPALIVSGPPGLGKSYTVETTLQSYGRTDASALATEEVGLMAEDPSVKMYDVVSGTITAVGLYISLFNMRNGGVLVLDDCDDAFRDETCLNLLKAVLDSSPVRRVSYRKKAHWMEEMGIPSSFEFKGAVVFCTNVDFEAAISRGNAMAPHYSALIDRCLYLSLTMRVKADFLCRLRHVGLEDGMLTAAGLTEEQAEELMEFVEENADRFYGLSLRLLNQMAICMKTDYDNWQDDVEATKMRTV